MIISVKFVEIPPREIFVSRIVKNRTIFTVTLRIIYQKLGSCIIDAYAISIGNEAEF